MQSRKTKFKMQIKIYKIQNIKYKIPNTKHKTQNMYVIQNLKHNTK